MARTSWQFSKNGDWGGSSNWTGGVPGVGDDAYLLAGSPYTVILSDARAVANLYIKGAGTTLVETATGHLAVAAGGVVDVRAGASLVLNGINDELAGRITGAGATVTLGAQGAAGTAAVALQGSKLFTTADMTLANDLSGSSGVLGAAAGTTLNVTGKLGGFTFGDADHGGTIVLNTGLSGLKVGGGTLVLGGGGNPGTFTVANGATLDLNGYDLIGPNRLQSNADGGGQIVNTGELAAIEVLGSNFAGAITGAIIVRSPVTSNGYRAAGSRFGGAVDLTGGGGIQLTNSYNPFNAGVSISSDGVFTLDFDGSDEFFATQVVISGGTLNIGCDITLLDRATGLSISSSGTIAGAVTGSGGFNITGDASVAMTGAGNQTFIGMNSTGTLTLTQANASRMYQTAGTVVLGNVAALGNGESTVNNGALVLQVGGAFTTDFTFYQQATLTVSAGLTASLDGKLVQGGTLTIGSAATKSVVVLNGAITGGESLAVAGGTLRAGTSVAAQNNLAQFENVSVASGARLDLAGQAMALSHLEGAGVVTSRTAAALTLYGADFGGQITGKLGVTIGVDPSANVLPGSVLTGDHSYTGKTRIDAGAALSLGDGGTTGSVKGAIVNNGVLVIDHANDIALANAVSGTGAVRQAGAGTTTFAAANSHSGGTFVDGGVLVTTGGRLGSGDVTINPSGTLQVSGSAPLGSGVVHMDGGQLRYSASATLGGTLDYGTTSTLSVARGATLTVTAGLTIDEPSYQIFGNGGNDGTIVLAPTQVSADARHAIFVDTGTLVIGNALAADYVSTGFEIRLANTTSILDLAGHSVLAFNLVQTGTILNSGAAAMLTIAGGSSEGTISGAITVIASADLSFTGAGDFTALIVDGAHTVTLGGAATESIDLQGSGATLVLAPGAAVTGHIAGFGEGDAFDFAAVSFGASTKLAYNPTSGVLRVTDGSHTATLVLDGSYVRADFALSNDGDGHAFVAFAGGGTASAGTFGEVAPAAFGAGDGPAFSSFDPHAASPAADMILA